MSGQCDIKWLDPGGCRSVFAFITLDLVGFITGNPIYDADDPMSSEPTIGEIGQALETMQSGRVLIALGRNNALALSEELDSALITSLDQWRTFKRHHELLVVMTASADKVTPHLAACA